MKPIPSSITEVNTLEGEEVKFSISAANSAFVMRSMADLYSVRELACVREYSTNAHDANLEQAIITGMDNPDPIQVTLPSAFNPYFVVQDTGVGMSLKTLKEVYTQFGESTKRDSDDFNGMLGFGSKSAVAYTNTFTVTSVRDGLKNVAVITRREDAMGGYLVTLKVVMADIPTSEHSGTKIEIPVHNHDAFARIAKDFYRFWKPGTVLVNGVEPEWAVGDKIADDLYYAPTHHESYVVMGNVPYRIANPRALFPQGMNPISFVAYVPMGTVEFTPNREELKYSEHTKSNLHKIITDFADNAKAKAANEVKDAKTHWEAYNAWTKWRNILGSNVLGDLYFKGEKLATSMAIVGDCYDSNMGRYNTNMIYNGHYDLNRVQNTIFITDFQVQNLSANHKKVAREWAGAKSIQNRFYVFTAEKKIASPWVDPHRVVTWETMKAEAPKPPKKPRAASVSWGRKAGSFDLFSVDKLREAEQDVPQVSNLYYMMIADYNKIAEGGWVSKVKDFFDLFNFTEKVVLVPANRKDKFLRNYTATNVMDHFSKNIETDGNKCLTADAKEYLALDRNDISWCSKIDPAKVKDPALVRVHMLAKQPRGWYTKEYDKNKRMCSMTGKSFKMVDLVENYYARRKSVLSNYSLINNYRNPDAHQYVYINAIYTARQNGENI